MNQKDFILRLFLLIPDYEALLLNIAGLYAYKKISNKFESYLNKILKRNPNNSKVNKLLSQIKQML